MILDLLDIGDHVVCGCIEIILMYNAYDAYIRGSDTPVNSTPLFTAFILFLNKLFTAILSGIDQLVAYYSVLQCCAAVCLYLSWRYSTTLQSPYFHFLFFTSLAAISIYFAYSQLDSLVFIDSLASLGLIASPLASIPYVIQDKSSIYLPLPLTLLLTLYTAIHICSSFMENDIYSFIAYVVGIILVIIQVVVYIVYFDTYYYTPILTQDKLTIHTENTKKRRSIDLIELGQQNDRRRSLELVELGQSHTPA
ncbi:hypothetical protein EON63_06125, partial [archaeon]